MAPHEPLDGKVALVTGGGRGIGAAVAVKLAEDGADVALTYVNDEDSALRAAERIKSFGRRVTVLRVDNADAARASAAPHDTVAELGRLDILVNNAAVLRMGPLEDLTAEDVDVALNINARGPFLLAQAAAGHMTRGGRIINIGSCSSRRVPFPALSLYSLSKTAMVGLTKGLARDLGPRGITANLVHPGPIETDMNPTEGAAADLNRTFLALGHYGQPWDVAATVSHLAGESGRYITGTEIDVDGGFAI